METVIKILLWIAFVVLLWYLIMIGIKKEEEVTCRKLAEQAKTYPRFYFADWQIEMCGME